MEPLTPKDLELALLKQQQAEREASDGKYAPMIVKTILYTLLGTLAGGVVLGLGQLVTSHFIDSFDAKEQTIQQVTPAAAAAAVQNIYDTGN